MARCDESCPFNIETVPPLLEDHSNQEIDADANAAEDQQQQQDEAGDHELKLFISALVGRGKLALRKIGWRSVHCLFLIENRLI